MKIITLNNYSKNEFNLKKIDNTTYKLECKKEKFLIEPGIAFNNSTIFNKNNMFKLRISLDEENIEHRKFKRFIKAVYDKISELIEEEDNNDDMFISSVKNPLNDNVLFSIINKSVEIRNYNNKERLNIEDVKNKQLLVYPIFWAPNINIYNEKVYINFVLYSCCINIIDEGLNEFKYDFKIVDAAMNKHLKKDKI